MPATEPRRHHHLARFYQRGFANDKDQVRVLDRRTGKEYATNISNVALRRDWNAFEDATGERRQEVEHLLADMIDAPAASAFAKLRAGEFPFSDEDDRSAVARFSAAQLVRGVGARENLSKFMSDVMGTGVALAAQHGSDEYWLRKAGEVPSEEVRQKLASRQGPEINPSKAHLLETLFSPIDDVAQIVFLRSWWLVVFDQPMLFTSTEPVLLAGPSGMPLGVGTADEIHLPVSPRAALVMVHPEPHWEDKLQAGTAVVASRLNTWHLSRSNSDSLLLDPRLRSHPLDSGLEDIPAAVLDAVAGESG